jgi:hypothetical protein
VGIHGKRLVKQGSNNISQDAFVAAIGRFSNPPPSFFPIPRGVKFFEWRGDAGVFVVEVEPSIRTVRLMYGGSPEGTLALPYLVFVFPFFQGVLQRSLFQVFYRTQGLTGWDNPLLFTNLWNVVKINGGKIPSYVSLGTYSPEPGLSWQERVEEVIRHFFWSSFIDSNAPGVHATLMKNIDKRVSSIKRWEEESRRDPRFMLSIPWPETGLTVRSAVDLSFSKIPHPPLNLINLVQDTQGGGNAQT